MSLSFSKRQSWNLRRTHRTQACYTPSLTTLIQRLVLCPTPTVLRRHPLPSSGGGSPGRLASSAPTAKPPGRGNISAVGVYYFRHVAYRVDSIQVISALASSQGISTSSQHLPAFAIFLVYGHNNRLIMLGFHTTRFLRLARASSRTALCSGEM